MNLILNIESATDICAVCLSEGENILAQQEILNTQNHAAQITMLVSKCFEIAKLQLRDLSAVAVSHGPGSYTSLRVGAATAKGICYALDLPLIAVDTLAALAVAVGAQQDELVVPMIDARRMEVYCSVFEANGKKIAPNEPKIIDNQSFRELITANKKLVFCGNGAAKCQPILTHNATRFRTDILCSARHLVPLSNCAFLAQQWEDVAYYAPDYGKAPNITISTKNKMLQS